MSHPVTALAGAAHHDDGMSRSRGIKNISRRQDSLMQPTTAINARLQLNLFPAGVISALNEVIREILRIPFLTRGICVWRGGSRVREGEIVFLRGEVVLKRTKSSKFRRCTKLS